MSSGWFGGALLAAALAGCAVSCAALRQAPEPANDTGPQPRDGGIPLPALLAASPDPEGWPALCEEMGLEHYDLTGPILGELHRCTIEWTDSAALRALEPLSWGGETWWIWEFDSAPADPTRIAAVAAVRAVPGDAALASTEASLALLGPEGAWPCYPDESPDWDKLRSVSTCPSPWIRSTRVESDPPMLSHRISWWMREGGHEYGVQVTAWPEHRPGETWVTLAFGREP